MRKATNPIMLLNLIATGSFSAQAQEPPHSFEMTFAQQHPTSQDCPYAPFTPRSYPKQLIMDLVAPHLPDPDNERFRVLVARCTDDTGDTLDVCGVAARMNAVGYISGKAMFSGRFRMVENRMSMEGLAIGPKASARCTKVTGG